MFLAEDFKEQSNRVPFFRELMLFQLPSLSDPSPTADQTRLSKEVGRDLQGIVARHVAVRIQAFKVDFIGLCDHGVMIDGIADYVQREF